MIKLYRKTETATYYHSAWINGKYIIEHWGMVGSTGKTKKHKFSPTLPEEECIQKILSAAEESGMSPIALKEHETLIVEYQESGDTAADLSKRHKIEEELNEILGWRGLGHCDGGSIGGGTFEAVCLVIDFLAAKQSIEYRLDLAGFGDFTRVYKS